MIMIIGAPALCLLVCLPFFMHYKAIMRYHLASMYKSAGTLCALIPALVAAIRLDPHCYVCAAALTLHTIADYVLEFRTYPGAALFMAGHVCYIAFFLHIFPVSAVHLVCLLCLIAVMAYTFYRNRKTIGKQLLPFTAYGITLSVMVSAAIGCISTGSTQGIMIAAGGALFFISDTFLFHRTLYPAARSISWIIMITYYAAQLLFGLSCLYIHTI